MRTMMSALLLAMIPSMGTAQEPGDADRRTVTVSAQASVQREPDRAVLMVAVESQAESAQEAARANAELMTRVLAALREAGVPERQIRTVHYDLQPIYSQPDPREPRPMEPWQPQIVGYRAHNMVRVEVDDVAAVGGVIDAALAAGANRIEGVHFELRDQDAAFNEALQQAVAKARAQASAAAAAAGQQLGLPVTMHVGTMMPYPQPMYRSAVMEMAAPPATPIQGGTLEIGASVTITYELLGG